MKVVILKNGSVIREFPSTAITLQRVFNTAHDIAGGLWNGVDTFSVKVIPSDKTKTNQL
jgi:hypothetical protein